MRKHIIKSLFYIGSFVSCFILSLTTGCVSGGFSLTRNYAWWVNSQSVVVRIILYILGFIVFIITLLIDLVVNNTVDFWNGRVSAGDYNFKGGDKTYIVRHEFLPGSNLKRSTIRIMDSNQKFMHEIVLNETPSHDIELYLDGKIRTRVHGISEIPTVTIFDKNGLKIEEKTVFLVPIVAGK